MRTLWLAALVACVAGPVVLVFVVGSGQSQPGSVWDDLAVITGTQAAALLAYVSAFASRLRTVTHVFGIDDMLALHRYLGVLTLLCVLLHLLAVIVDDPGQVWLLGGLAAPARAAAGLAALIALGALVGLAHLRARLDYRTWRRGHVGLAAAVLVFVALHVLWLERLINVPAWRVLFVGLTVTVLAVGALRWLWRPLTAAQPLTVSDVRPLSADASAVTLRPMRGRRWHFRPGQFAWVRLGRSAWADDHPFSMASAPGRSVEFLISHRGDWTRGPIRALRPGARVWLDGPHGSVTLTCARGRRLLLVGAGVGLAPLLSMLRTMAATQDDRAVRLVVPPQCLYGEELARLSGRLRLRISPILSRSMSPDQFRAALPHSLADCDAFVCGSPAMVASVSEMLFGFGIPASRIHAERFGLADEART